MGIKYFFSWLKSEFPHHFVSFKKQQPPPNVSIDTFMIDLNGIFHNSASKTYQYGSYEKKSLLKRQTPKFKLNQNDDTTLRLKCFEDICNTIEELVRIVNPKKQLVMCIDGVAPLSKQNQQRQRRYRSLVESTEAPKNENMFDSRCITPGTKFMSCLSEYIDYFIHKQITQDESWKHLNVIFSDDKVPGEGEHKLVDFIRKYGTEEETYCINALDADLVMLSLGTHKNNFFLLREELYDKSFDYSYVNIGSGLRPDIVKNILFFEGSDEKSLVNDFILICFLCGNDFLPNIPSISLLEKGISTIIDMYKLNASRHGHLTEGEIIRFSSFQNFLSLIAQSEKSLLEEKYVHRQNYIPDPLLEKHVKRVEERDSYRIDFDSYKEEFYKKHGLFNIEEACKSYIQGCTWILSYYLKGITNWTYVYEYNYSPFAFDLALHMTGMKVNVLEPSSPIQPFLQLLCVIPPTSSYLLPKPLDSILLKQSELSVYFPTKFNINYEGKKKKWEGVVELPPVNVKELEKVYVKFLKNVHSDDIKRNKPGHNLIYTYSNDNSSEHKSFYGKFLSSCSSKFLKF